MRRAQGKLKEKLDLHLHDGNYLLPPGAVTNPIFSRPTGKPPLDTVTNGETPSSTNPRMLACGLSFAANSIACRARG